MPNIRRLFRHVFFSGALVLFPFFGFPFKCESLIIGVQCNIDFQEMCETQRFRFEDGCNIIFCDGRSTKRNCVRENDKMMTSRNYFHLCEQIRNIVLYQSREFNHFNLMHPKRETLVEKIRKLMLKTS